MQPGGIVERLRPADTSTVQLRVSTASLTGRTEVALDDSVMETETDGAEDCAYVSVPAFTIQLRPKAAPVSVDTATTNRTCRNFTLLIEAVFLSSIKDISVYINWA